jgi:hypothetical protein
VKQPKMQRHKKLVSLFNHIITVCLNTAYNNTNTERIVKLELELIEEFLEEHGDGEDDAVSAASRIND